MRNRLIYLGLILLITYIGWRVYQHQLAKEALPDRKFLIQANVEKKLEIYATEIRNKCNREMLEDAIVLADSIAFLKADSLMLFDTVVRPAKPGKPELPEKLPLKESLEVAPLIPLSVDTLN